ncbi:exosome complex exonuclease RRP6 [Kluyveromyces marxianus DMKU3-1042]|uniref:Exosome complex exonuclease RRP6 n=1 Tax=Kluyveromyces marxianus (strain DMKU3-1042 / BCC 29191 / NBRC 104275) TaxID=1003335 RepID=W0TFF1_KLUMD|nr:exosome complex exonuclease RRP6 [Kluyveromyces marxianus DMKU3-1042]BAO42352.1 exosome complex exonuclease RRP6 [Kluyveromyces marxianus DMKU3-1042]
MTSNEQDALLSSLMQTVRSSSALAAQDIDFYRSLDSDVNSSLQDTSSKMLSLINEVLLSIDPNNDTIEEGKDEFLDSWKSISNIMDNLFEKSDHALDNIKNKTSNSATDSGFKYLNDDDRSNSNPSKRLAKPQLDFKIPVDNTELHPFKPLLKEKPNSLKPLELSLKMLPEEENIPAHYPNPYEYEIENQKYDDSILVPREPIPSRDWDNTTAIWVDTVEELTKMIEVLKKSKEIAIDLEHHDYRSYYGIVCLMQISDRENDWIVDTIALRDDLKVLNEIFTDPGVVKVLHGAFMDIIWLQRDLGLYIVGLFDTYHASRLLGFPKHSLAYLLERFANFKTSKKYQLADWRIRPLSKPMFAYARADTHFLLNIFDQLRNMLLEQNKMSEVLHESRKVAKRRFEYSSFRPKIGSQNVYSPIESAEPWRNLMFQYNIPPSKEQLLRKLYEWRDMIARRDDESPRYVMPNQLLVSLVAGTPTEPINVLSVSSYVSEHVRMNSKAIANLIKKTLEDMKQGTSGKKNPLSVPSISEEGDKDLSEILTISQIKSIQNMFNSVAKQINAGSSESNVDINVPSLLFNGVPNAEYNSAVVYTSKGKTVVTKDELSKRQKLITDTLEQEYTEKHTQSIQIPSLQTSETTETTTEHPSNEIEEQPEETQEQEDKDEIVTLRKRQAQNAKKRKAVELPSDSEIVDYTSGENLLVSNRKNTDHEKNKKRKFDPYSIENTGPKAIKKKAKPTKGKNVSFKR